MHHRWKDDLDNARQTRDVEWRVLASIGGGYTMVQSDVLEHHFSYSKPHYLRQKFCKHNSLVPYVAAISRILSRWATALQNTWLPFLIAMRALETSLSRVLRTSITFPSMGKSMSSLS
jgi:hypothetical protein